VLALALTRRVAPELAADPQLEYGFLLHDLGKIGIRDAVLLKPGPLTASEREEMEFHPRLGERIVARVPYLAGVARQVVASHHERWDGHGYPRRLSGNGIPLSARIFAVVDAYDAMTNERPYRAPLPLENALGQIADAAGTQFDPGIVRVFLDLLEEREAA
jgi:HD-GYP domain-containing protein (c-di-GMP phosphodiesterase class II)